MKKITLTLIILILTTLFVSCKTSQPHCDAYGNKSASVTEELDFDIHTNESQYTSTIIIK